MPSIHCCGLSIHLPSPPADDPPPVPGEDRRLQAGAQPAPAAASLPQRNERSRRAYMLNCFSHPRGRAPQAHDLPARVVADDRPGAAPGEGGAEAAGPAGDAGRAEQVPAVAAEPVGAGAGAAASGALQEQAGEAAPVAAAGPAHAEPAQQQPPVAESAAELPLPAAPQGEMQGGEAPPGGDADVASGSASRRSTLSTLLEDDEADAAAKWQHAFPAYRGAPVQPDDARGATATVRHLQEHGLGHKDLRGLMHGLLAASGGDPADPSCPEHVRTLHRSLGNVIDLEKWSPDQRRRLIGALAALPYVEPAGHGSGAYRTLQREGVDPQTLLAIYSGIRGFLAASRHAGSRDDAQAANQNFQRQHAHLFTDANLASHADFYLGLMAAIGRGEAGYKYPGYFGPPISVGFGAREAQLKQACRRGGLSEHEAGALWRDFTGLIGALRGNAPDVVDRAELFAHEHRNILDLKRFFVENARERIDEKRALSLPCFSSVTGLTLQSDIAAIDRRYADWQRGPGAGATRQERQQAAEQWHANRQRAVQRYLPGGVYPLLSLDVLLGTQATPAALTRIFAQPAIAASMAGVARGLAHRERNRARLQQMVADLAALETGVDVSTLQKLSGYEDLVPGLVRYAAVRVSGPVLRMLKESLAREIAGSGAAAGEESGALQTAR